MRCPRADLQSVPGRPWSPLVRQKDRSARSALDWDRQRRVTPAGAGSQETRPGAEPMLVATGVASPRRSAGRRARPLPTLSAQAGRKKRQGRASAASATAMCRCGGPWMACAFRRSASLFVFRCWWWRQNSGARRAAGMPALIRPRTQCGGGGPRPCAVEGACGDEDLSDAVRAAPPRPLPPRCCAARCPFPASRGRISLMHAGAAERQLEMRGGFGERCRCRRRGCGVACVNGSRASRCFGVSIRLAGTCWIFIVRRHGWRSSLMVLSHDLGDRRSAIVAAMHGFRSVGVTSRCAFP